MSLSQHVEPHRSPAPLGLMVSVVIAALGGFVGGLFLEHGPTYLHVHLAQPMLDGEVEALEPDPVRLVAETSVLPMEPRLIADAELVVVNASGAEARIVVNDGKSAYLVLQDAAPRKWGVGRVGVTQPEELLTTLSQATDAKAIPASHSSWIGASVTLYDAEGFSCSGTVSTLMLLEQFSGDGMVRDGWEEYGEGPALVAKIETNNGSCKDATWGRHAELETPRIGRIKAATKAERREATRTFRRSAAYRKFQKEYLAEGHKGNWDHYWESELTIRVIRSAEQELIFVQAQVGGCGDFEGQLGTLFERQESGALQAVSTDNHFTQDIVSAADIDGDGDLDFVSQGDGANRALMQRSTSGLETKSATEVGIYYCRC